MILKHWQGQVKGWILLKFDTLWWYFDIRKHKTAISAKVGRDQKPISNTDQKIGKNIQLKSSAASVPSYTFANVWLHIQEKAKQLQVYIKRALPTIFTFSIPMKSRAKISMHYGLKSNIYTWYHIAGRRFCRCFIYYQIPLNLSRNDGIGRVQAHINRHNNWYFMQFLHFFRYQVMQYICGALVSAKGSIILDI